MSIDFVLVGLVFFITIECSYKLLVCIGVICCGCPISMRAVICDATSEALIYIALVYASPDKVITTLIIRAMFNTSPLFLGFLSLSDKNKYPPAWLLALVSLR